MLNQNLTAYKDHISKIIPISHEIWGEVEAIWTPRKLKKNEFIVEENQKFNKEIFVHKGVIRGFYTPGSGVEINISFYQEDELVCPYFARITNGRSNISLQAITPALIFEAEQDKMKTLRHKHRGLLLYSSIVVENELRTKTQHEKLLLVKDTEERFRMFQSTYPQLEQKISHYHIASYLRLHRYRSADS
jgi:CRP-like cAMP-binding protein